MANRLMDNYRLRHKTVPISTNPKPKENRPPNLPTISSAKMLPKC